METHEICFVFEGLDDETAAGTSRGSGTTLTSSLSFYGKALARVFLRKSPSPTESWTERERERVSFSETMTALWF